MAQKPEIWCMHCLRVRALKYNSLGMLFPVCSMTLGGN